MMVKSEQESEWKSLRRFGSLRVVGGIIVIAIVSFFTFLVATSIMHIPKNTKAIVTNCKMQNEQLAKVNSKFAQLNQLFDGAIKRNAAEGRPTPPEILAAYETYKEPIRLAECNG